MLLEHRWRRFREIVRGIAFVLVAAVLVVGVAAVMDNLGSSASRHTREILWWLTMYGTCCGAAGYGLLREIFGAWEGAVQARRYAPMTAFLVASGGAGILMIAAPLDAIVRRVVLAR